MQTTKTAGCPFCDGPGGEVLYEDVAARIVLVNDAEGAAFPGFCRVIWKCHVREMSDLSRNDLHHCFDLVLAAELAVRDVQRPDKMNVASLGNMVPHLHWHIIPRWQDDSHFPAPIWAPAHRAAASRAPADAAALRAAIAARLDLLKVQ